MGFEIKKETVIGGAPVFQRDYENAQGGFTLDTTGLDAGAEVPEGSIMGYDEDTRKAKVLKVAKVHENAADDATTIKVAKGHLLIVGSIVAKTVGGAARAVSAIDKSNANYDVVTVDATLGVALSAGDVLFESSASGDTAAALKVEPKGLLYQSAKAEVNTPVSVCIRATVYERRIPVVPVAVKSLLPNIIFSKSY